MHENICISIFECESIYIYNFIFTFLLPFSFHQFLHLIKRDRAEKRSVLHLKVVYGEWQEKLRYLKKEFKLSQLYEKSTLSKIAMNDTGKHKTKAGTCT